MNELGKKAEKMIRARNILLANTNGPATSKRRVLVRALQSAITYAAPIWASALHCKRNVGKLRSLQRSMLLRCCSGYCTVSADAAAVIAGRVPIDLLINERTRIRMKQKENTQTSEEIKRKEREATLDMWQQQWAQGLNNKARWTRSVLRSVRDWIYRKHGEVDYYLTQALTGHGCFGEYFFRIKKAASPSCTCGERVDDAKHTLFACPMFNLRRIHMELQIGHSIGKQNLGETMLHSKQKWKCVHSFIKDVLILKKRKERDAERRAQ